MTAPQTHPSGTPPPRGTQPGEPVGPVKAVQNFFRRGFRFSGRASRSEYWWIFLFAAIIAIVWELGPEEFWGSRTLSSSTAAGFVVFVVWIICCLAALVLAVFNIALSVRRLHDANLSGLWALLLLLPPLGTLALIVMATLPPDPRGVRFDR